MAFPRSLSLPTTTPDGGTNVGCCCWVSRELIIEFSYEIGKNKTREPGRLLLLLRVTLCVRRRHGQAWPGLACDDQTLLALADNRLVIISASSCVFPSMFHSHTTLRFLSLSLSLSVVCCFLPCIKHSFIALISFFFVSSLLPILHCYFLAPVRLSIPCSLAYWVSSASSKPANKSQQDPPHDFSACPPPPPPPSV